MQGATQSVRCVPLHDAHTFTRSHCVCMPHTSDTTGDFKMGMRMGMQEMPRFAGFPHAGSSQGCVQNHRRTCVADGEGLVRTNKQRWMRLSRSRAVLSISRGVALPLTKQNRTPASSNCKLTRPGLKSTAGQGVSVNSGTSSYTLAPSSAVQAAAPSICLQAAVNSAARQRVSEFASKPSSE